MEPNRIPPIPCDRCSHPYEAVFSYQGPEAKHPFRLKWFWCSHCDNIRKPTGREILIKPEHVEAA